MDPNQPQYPPPAAVAPARSGPGFSITLADTIVGGACLLFFFFSFAGQYSVSLGFGRDASGGSSWDDASHLFPVLAGLLAVAGAVIAPWWPKGKEYLGFQRSQILVGLTLFMFVTMLSFVFGGGFGGLSGLGGFSLGLGWGGWIQLILALAAAAGAVLGHLGILTQPLAMPKTAAPAAYPGAYQPPAGYQQPPAGYPPPPGYPPAQAPPGYPPQSPTQGDTVV